MAYNFKFDKLKGTLIKVLDPLAFNCSNLSYRFECGACVYLHKDTYGEEYIETQMLYIQIHDNFLNIDHVINFKDITKDLDELTWLCERIANSNMNSIILAEKTRFTRIEEKEQELQELKTGRYY